MAIGPPLVLDIVNITFGTPGLAVPLFVNPKKDKLLLFCNLPKRYLEVDNEFIPDVGNIAQDALIVNPEPCAVFKPASTKEVPFQFNCLLYVAPPLSIIL
jgi:hypothetical protein